MALYNVCKAPSTYGQSPKYYKHLKKGAHQSQLGRHKMGCTSSKTEIFKQNMNLDFNPEFSS